MKKIAANVVIGFAIIMAATMILTSCGAEWAACETCKLGEEAAQSADGGQIPVVVNVDVDVNVNVEQTQSQSQDQSGSGCNTCPQDAGLPPVVDAGTPSKPDAGCPPVCRKVCVKTETWYVCKNGKITNHKSDCDHCNGVKKTFKKCIKEATQCS